MLQNYKIELCYTCKLTTWVHLIFLHIARMFFTLWTKLCVWKDNVVARCSILLSRAHFGTRLKTRLVYFPSTLRTKLFSFLDFFATWFGSPNLTLNSVGTSDYPCCSISKNFCFTFWTNFVFLLNFTLTIVALHSFFVFWKIQINMIVLCLKIFMQQHIFLNYSLFIYNTVPDNYTVSR